MHVKLTEHFMVRAHERLGAADRLALLDAAIDGRLEATARRHEPDLAAGERLAVRLPGGGDRGA